MTWLPSLRMLGSRRSLLLAATSALVVFALQVWLPNLGLIWSVVVSGSLAPIDKVGFLWASLGAIGTNFTLLGASLAVVVSLLFGLNVALTVAYFRVSLDNRSVGALSMAGLLAAVVGVGCSACGAVVLSALVGVTATAAVVARLPLGGQELNLLAVLILVASVAFTARRLSQPVVCAVPTTQTPRSSHPINANSSVQRQVPPSPGAGEEVE